MALAVKSSMEIVGATCNLCGKSGKMIRVDTYREQVTLCLDWPAKGRRCFDKKFPFGIIECGSSKESEDTDE